jgi:hypothetical protein
VPFAADNNPDQAPDARTFVVRALPNALGVTSVRVFAPPRDSAQQHVEQSCRRPTESGLRAAHRCTNSGASSLPVHGIGGASSDAVVDRPRPVLVARIKRWTDSLNFPCHRSADWTSTRFSVMRWLAQPYLAMGLGRSQSIVSQLRRFNPVGPIPDCPFVATIATGGAARLWRRRPS